MNRIDVDLAGDAKGVKVKNNFVASRDGKNWPKLSKLTLTASISAAPEGSKHVGVQRRTTVLLAAVAVLTFVPTKV